MTQRHGDKRFYYRFFIANKLECNKVLNHLIHKQLSSDKKNSYRPKRYQLANLLFRFMMVEDFLTAGSFRETVMEMININSKQSKNRYPAFQFIIAFIISFLTIKLFRQRRSQ